MNNNFQKWFQKSVVKKDRKPLVVYHGTNINFTEFHTLPENRGFYGLGETAIGSHFSESKEIASAYPVGDSNKKVMEVYLSIQNPKKYRTINHLRSELMDYCIDNDIDFVPGINRLNNVSKYRDYLIEQGYDGITYLEGPPYNIKQNKSRVWVAFYPWQIKSTLNKGTFNSSNHNIFE